MTSSSPIFAPIKRVAIPGIVFSFEQNMIETAISFSTNSLEFKTKNKVVGRLTRPLAKLGTKLKTHQNTLELSLDSLELLDKMFLTNSGEYSLVMLLKHAFRILFNTSQLASLAVAAARLKAWEVPQTLILEAEPFSEVCGLAS